MRNIFSIQCLIAGLSVPHSINHSGERIDCLTHPLLPRSISQYGGFPRDEYLSARCSKQRHLSLSKAEGGPAQTLPSGTSNGQVSNSSCSKTTFAAYTGFPKATIASPRFLHYTYAIFCLHTDTADLSHPSRPRLCHSLLPSQSAGAYPARRKES